MKFDDFASKETSELVGRVVAGSAETARRQLQAFRSALDAATTELEAMAGKSPDVEGEIVALVSRLTEAASSAAEAAANRVAAEAGAAADKLQAEWAAEKDALSTALTEARAQTDAARADLASHVKDAQSREDALRTELSAEKDRAEAARRAVVEAGEARKKLDAARAEAIAARDKEAAARAGTEGELRNAHARLETARTESAATLERLEIVTTAKARQDEALAEAQSLAQAADAKLSAVSALFQASAARVKVLERNEQSHAQALRDLQSRLEGASGANGAADAEKPAVTLLDDLLGSFQALSSATAIPDVLATLMEQLAAEFPRVALFRVKGNRLEGEHHIGFDLATDITKVVLPLGMDSLLTRAASTGRIERLSGGELTDSSRAPFGGTPSCALALPVVVHGETLGIVYADDSGQSETGAAGYGVRDRVADALLQHAVALLLRLTTELRTLAELRAYASSLLAEIEQMFTSDMAGGKTGEELRRRLKGNLEYARSIYANRIAVECPDAAGLLDDQIVSAARAQAGTAFGRDLAAVADLAMEDGTAAEAS